MKKLKETKFYAKCSQIWNNRFFSVPWVRLGFLAILLNFIIECLSRHSVVKGFVYLGQHPFAYLFNCLMIFFTLSISMMFRKRIFVAFFISAVWFGFGVTNFIIRGSRKTPFTAPDFLNIPEGIRIITKYFSVFKIILVIVLLALLIGAVIFLAIKSPKVKGKINYMLSALVFTTTFGVIMLINYISNATGLIPKNFGNIVNAYDTYGFGYVFSCSLFRSGISKPKDYSSTKIENVLQNVDDKIDNGEEPAKPSTDEDMPNIIFLQLESFFDATKIKDIELSKDPIPTMRALYDAYPSGFLSVPSFGAGTANTEFEVITGMNLDDFGPGEYPYKTVLRNNACESICYYLAEKNYKCSALHNNEGDFYSRNTVFSRLGFDNFISLEYMNKYERNPIGWPKDNCLIGEITDILDYTKQKDFIYTISVQGHGDYPTEIEGIDFEIDVLKNNVTGNPAGFKYYVNQIYEMDMFVGELIRTLEKRNEKTVLVIYGDHLPTFDITDDDLENGDIYQTQYVIWNNFGLENTKKDIQAFQLSSYVMKLLGISGGVISKLHVSSFYDENN